MAQQALTNFSGGEVSQDLFGRSDSELYRNSLRRMQNFYSRVQGPADYRGGSRYVHPTRNQEVCRIENFKFNDEQVYILMFTNLKVRITEDAAMTLETSGDTISGASQAAECVVTATGHSHVDGDEVYIDGVVGMTELNGRFFVVSDAAANTFKIKDLFGNYVDSSGFTAYSSAGTATAVLELATPYTTAQLDAFQFDQVVNELYIDHRSHLPRKLTRVSATSWTFGTYTRTVDPFGQVAVSAATQANPCEITSATHGLSTGDVVIIEDIVGMTELNGRTFTVTKVDDTKFTLDGENSSAYAAYVSGGVTADQDKQPGCVISYEGRVNHASSVNNPDTLWMSRGPNVGTSRYDDYTTGADADHAIIVPIPSLYINWLAKARDFIQVGTTSGVSGIDGGSDSAITPSNIRVRPIDPYGVQSIMPAQNGDVAFYMQKGSRILRSLEYTLLSDAYKSFDRSFVSAHMTQSSVKKMAFQRGKSDILWIVRNDGVLVGITVKEREDVSGWHRHVLGGTGDTKVLSVAVEPQEKGYDRVYMVVERTINSTTVRYLEYFTDPFENVLFEDYYTGEDNETADRLTYANEVYEEQRKISYLDGCSVFNGSSRGGSITMTPGAVTGSGITFTASGGLFAATDVDKEIQKKYKDKAGGGRAIITAYVNTTTVTCEIISDFDNTDAIVADDWFLTAEGVSGLHHLEGETVQVVADGRIDPDVVVTNGEVTITRQAGTIAIGFNYEGILVTLPLVASAQLDNTITDVKNISDIALIVANSVGGLYGTSMYNMQQITSSRIGQSTDRPPLPFTGPVSNFYEDSWDEDKVLVVLQNQPYPLFVNAINATLEIGTK